MRDVGRLRTWLVTPLLLLLAAALRQNSHPLSVLVLGVVTATAAVGAVWLPVRATRWLVRLGLADARLGASLLHATSLTWWRHAMAWLLVVTPFCVDAAHRMTVGTPLPMTVASLYTADAFLRSRLFLDAVELFGLGLRPDDMPAAGRLFWVTFASRTAMSFVLTRVVVTWIQRFSRRLRREEIGKSVLDQVERAILGGDTQTARPLLLRMNQILADARTRLGWWCPVHTLPPELRNLASAAADDAPRRPALPRWGVKIAGSALVTTLGAVAASSVRPQTWICLSGVIAAVALVIWSRDVVSLLLAGRVRMIGTVRGLTAAQAAVSLFALSCIVALTANWVAQPLYWARLGQADVLPSSGFALAMLNVLRAEIFFDVFDVAGPDLGVDRLGAVTATRLLITRSAIDLIVLTSISRASWRLTMSYVTAPSLAASCPLKRLAVEAARCDAASGLHAADALRVVRVRMRGLVRNRRPAAAVAGVLLEFGWTTERHLIAELESVLEPAARVAYAMRLGDALLTTANPALARRVLRGLRGAFADRDGQDAEEIWEAVVLLQWAARALERRDHDEAALAFRAAAKRSTDADPNGGIEAACAVWEAHCVLQSEGPTRAAEIFSHANGIATGAGDDRLRAIALAGAARCLALGGEIRALTVFADARRVYASHPRLLSGRIATVEYCWLRLHEARAAARARSKNLTNAVRALSRSLADARAAGLDPDDALRAQSVALRCRAATDRLHAAAPPTPDDCRAAWRTVGSPPPERPGCVDRFVELEARLDLLSSALPWLDAAERLDRFMAAMPDCRRAGARSARGVALDAVRILETVVGERCAADDASGARRAALAALRSTVALVRHGAADLDSRAARLRGFVVAFREAEAEPPARGVHEVATSDRAPGVTPQIGDESGPITPIRVRQRSLPRPGPAPDAETDAEREQPEAFR